MAATTRGAAELRGFSRNLFAPRLDVKALCGDLPSASGSAGPAALEGDDTAGADVVRETSGCTELAEGLDAVRMVAGCARNEPRLDATAPRLDLPEGAATVGAVLELAAGLAPAVGLMVLAVTEVSLALPVVVRPADASLFLSIGNAARIGLLRSTCAGKDCWDAHKELVSKTSEPSGAEEVEASPIWLSTRRARTFKEYRLPLGNSSFDMGLVQTHFRDACAESIASSSSPPSEAGQLSTSKALPAEAWLEMCEGAVAQSKHQETRREPEVRERTWTTTP